MILEALFIIIFACLTLMILTSDTDDDRIFNASTAIVIICVMILFVGLSTGTLYIEQAVSE